MSKTLRFRVGFLLILTVLHYGGIVSADDTESPNWPQFLGPERNGVSEETGLLDAWPSGGPPVVWRVPGGAGLSGVAVSGDRVYTIVQKAGKQVVISLNAKTGKTIWETPVSDAYSNSMGNGPRATPTAFQDQVFAFTGQGKLVALKTEDGSIAWSHDVVRDHGSEKEAEYGMASSPLVADDAVIVTAGAKDATVVAYDVKTGKLKWTSGRDQPAGYSSPALLKVGGREQVVVFHGSAAEGLAGKTGTSFWRYPYVTDYDCNIATPIAIEGNVFLSSGENHGCVLLSLKESPSGTLTATEVWQSQGPRSVLRNEWQTSVLLGGHLFGFDNVGSAGPVTHLTCVDAKTGERKWQEPRFGKGNLIAADGMLIISTMKGELVLVKANPERFEELARAKLLGMTRQAPALAGGFVYLRDEKDILCVDLRKR